MCTYIIRTSVHTHYTGDVCIQTAETQRKGSRYSNTGSFYSYLLSVCVLYIHIFHIIHIMFTKSLYKHIYALYTIIIQESIQKQLCQLIDYLKRVRFFERRGRSIKEALCSLFSRLWEPQGKDSISQGGRVGGKITKTVDSTEVRKSVRKAMIIIKPSLTII